MDTKIAAYVDKVEAKWPKGQYCILSPNDWCPGGFNRVDGLYGFKICCKE